MQGPVMSKDQNEKVLDAVDIIAKLPENAVCADCGDKAPRYVNGQYGIFICRSCAEVHKTLMDPGNVRSMDTGLRDFWPKKFGENLSKIGNKNAAQIWENTLHDEDPAVYRPSPKKSHFVVSWFSAQPLEHREEWIRSKYVGKFFVEPKKGFLLIQWRDKGTPARTCFVQIKSKTVVIYDDEYPPKPTSLLEQHEGQTLTLMPLTYQDPKKKKGPYFEMKTPRGMLRMEPRAPDTDVVLQEWWDALQQLQGRVTYLRNREMAVNSERPAAVGSSSIPSPGRGWVATKPVVPRIAGGDSAAELEDSNSSAGGTTAASSSAPLTDLSATSSTGSRTPSATSAPISPRPSAGSGPVPMVAPSTPSIPVPASTSGTSTGPRSIRGLTVPSGYAATVLASYAGQELLVLLSAPGNEAKPPAFAVFKHGTNLVVELAVFHNKATLKQKGQMINVALKPDEELREHSIACFPPPMEAELVIIVPTHMQRENVTDSEGRLRITLSDSEQEISIVTVKSPTAK